MIYDESIVPSPESDLTAQPSSGIGMYQPGETGAYDQGIFAPQDVGLNPMQVAPTAPAAAEPSITERIGKALYNFGAGSQGHPLWDERKQALADKKKQADLEEIKGLTTALEHGISMVQGVEGPERDSFVESYAKRLDGIQAGMGDTFKALSKRPDMLSQFKDYAMYLPEPTQALMKSNPKEFLKLAGTAEGQKLMSDAKDRFDMRVATKKVQTTLVGLQQYVPAEELKKVMADGIITASDVMSVQKYLPKELQLSPTENEAVQRNDKTFWGGLGVLHGASEQGVMAERAKRADKATGQPAHLTVGGQTYEWDPEKKLTGARLGSDSRYALLGASDKPSAGGLPKDVVDRELKLSDDYRQDSKKFSERRPIFEAATDYYANRKDNKTSAGDAALAFAYAKSRDPNDRLAVSETRDLAKLGNMFERLGVNIVGVLDKGETLPDRVAKEMFDEISRKFKEENKAQLKLERHYVDKVKAYGGEPGRVVRSLGVADLDNGDKPASDGLERKTIGKVTYVKKGGQWYEERQ